MGQRFLALAGGANARIVVLTAGYARSTDAQADAKAIAALLSPFLMGTIAALSINPSLYAKLPYDPIADFAPVAFTGRFTVAVIVNSIGSNFTRIFPKHRFQVFMGSVNTRVNYSHYDLIAFFAFRS